MNVKVHGALVLVSLIYAIVFVIAKEIMPAYVKPFGLIFIRVSIATLLLWAFHRLYVKEKIQRKDFGRFLACAIFGVAVNMLLFFKGLSLTTPINGAVIMVTTPILVTFLSFIVLKDSFKIYHWMGLLCGAVGATVLMGGRHFSFNGSNLWGDFLVFINAVSYSFYLVLVKPLVDKYHPITILKWVFFLGLILITPFCIQDIQAVQWSAMPPIIVIEILFLGIFATFITYLLNGWAMQKANPALVGFYIYLQPILTTTIAIWRGKDSLSTDKIISAGLIFLGVYWVNLNKIQAMRAQRKAQVKSNAISEEAN